MILVPAGSPEGRAVGDREAPLGDGETSAAGLEVGDGEEADDAPPGDAESSGEDPEVDDPPQPTTSRQTTRTRLFMRQV
jgi:hypothetical protein